MQRFVFLLLVLPLLVASIGFTPAAQAEFSLQVTPEPTPAAQPFQVVNHLGGGSEAVVVEGDYAYLGHRLCRLARARGDPALPV